MQTLDFSKLLDTRDIAGAMPPMAVSVNDLYRDGEGAQFRSTGANSELIQDIVRLSDHAFLFASDQSAVDVQVHRQVVENNDWIHIQFRLAGNGREEISRDLVETPEKSCIIARYPRDSVVERWIDKSDSYKVACLLVSPKGLTDLLDISAPNLPGDAAWMGLQVPLEFQTAILPLQSAMIFAVNDILCCSYKGGIRRAYMRAKSLELLSMVMHSLHNATEPSRSTVRLSLLDYDRIAAAREIMAEDLESRLTLAQLARKVGLNRTKLALGFKEVHGTSVQAYWRDLKLNQAREMLRDDRVRVTEVALSMGYSELSSFTRAFSRKFHILPRDCKGRVD